MGLQPQIGGDGISSHLDGGLPPRVFSTPSFRPERRTAQEIVHEMPFARLASIAGYKGWTIRFEERFPGGHLGTERESRIVVTGAGTELTSQAFSGVRNSVFEILAADQILQQLPAAGQGGPVEGSVFSSGRFGARLLGVCRSLDLPCPRVALVSGNPEQLRLYLSQCFMPIGKEMFQSSGNGRSLTEAYGSAAGKLLKNSHVGALLRVGSETDPTTALVGGARRAGIAKPQFLLHTLLQPIGVAVELSLPGSDPRRFLGHADTLQHAREVAASRAYYWLSHRTREIRRAVREAPPGATEH